MLAAAAAATAAPSPTARPPPGRGGAPPPAGGHRCSVTTTDGSELHHVAGRNSMTAEWGSSTGAGGEPGNASLKGSAQRVLHGLAVEALRWEQPRRIPAGSGVGR